MDMEAAMNHGCDDATSQLTQLLRFNANMEMKSERSSQPPWICIWPVGVASPTWAGV